jgi:hypothetical protein
VCGVSLLSLSRVGVAASSQARPGQPRGAWTLPPWPPCAVDLRRERERAGGGDGRRLRGGREWNTGSRVRDLFIRSKHDFSHWIDDRWSIIAGPVGLKRA